VTLVILSGSGQDQELKAEHERNGPCDVPSQSHKRPITYFDISVGRSTSWQGFIFQLYNDLVPKNCREFPVRIFHHFCPFHFHLDTYSSRASLVSSQQAHFALVKKGIGTSGKAAMVQGQRLSHRVIKKCAYTRNIRVPLDIDCCVRSCLYAQIHDPGW